MHETLREAIISGRLKTDERLNERDLASELGISTTPLKEALRQLESEGLVRIEARRGVYVTFNARRAEELILARAALESVLARQAARHANETHIEVMRDVVGKMQMAVANADLMGLIELNERFHDIIHDASGCEYLRRLQNGQRMYHHTARLTILAEEKERVRSHAEHESIMKAIAVGDEDEAEQLMRRHVMEAGKKHISAVFETATREKQE
ncbi:MAG: GntR family transcriptional regulator [Rhizobiaceae bacterium]|nr:GntR family transcriptional regulator [Rhizobiaceae bacterium]